MGTAKVYYRHVILNTKKPLKRTLNSQKQSIIGTTAVIIGMYSVIYQGRRKLLIR